MIQNWLTLPFPFIKDIKFNVLVSVGVSLVAFFVLYIFRPFDLHEVKELPYFIGLGCMSILGTGMHLLLFPRVLPKFYDSDQWNIGKHLVVVIMTLFTISILNFTFNTTYGADIAPQYNFFTMVSMTVAVGVLPVLIWTYVFEKYESRKQLTIAQSIEIPALVEEEDTLEIIPETNQHERLNILTSAFLFAEADKNYCHVYYLFQGAVKTQLMRLSLKHLLDQFTEKPQLVRVHKSYIVNKENVESISGNARSLLLTIKNSEKEIPVSRSFDRSQLTTSPSHT